MENQTPYDTATEQVPDENGMVYFRGMAAAPEIQKHGQLPKDIATQMEENGSIYMLTQEQVDAGEHLLYEESVKHQEV